MRAVLLGGAGYIGTVTAAHLAAHGDEVLVLDDLIYPRHDDPGRLLPPPATFTRADIRDRRMLLGALPGADVVVHLGGVVGEPACAVDETLAIEENYAAPVIAAQAATAADVPHVVFLSSCSVYGRQDSVVSEDTPVNPLGCYARTKAAAEDHLTRICADRAQATILRLATVFGLSPRMRLDSVVNAMSARAAATGVVPQRGGQQWRPLVHVADVADVIARVIHRPGGSPQGREVFNVGPEGGNYTIAHIARTVADVVPGARIHHAATPEDGRSYQVSFQRLAAAFPGTCATGLEAGVAEIAAATRRGVFGDVDDIGYDNLRGLQAAVADRRVAPLRSRELQDLTGQYRACWGQR